MGNYERLELDFINRTLALIAQYESDLHQYEFEQQFNYTLLINCLLGLIVLPKERTISYIPNERLTTEIKNSMGLFESFINPDIRELRELIIALRHAVAHFDINVVSNNENFLVDEIVFSDTSNGGVPNELVRFKSEELLPFIRYYASRLTRNIENYG